MGTATFGAGCFWGIEVAFRKLKGVIINEIGIDDQISVINILQLEVRIFVNRNRHWCSVPLFPYFVDGSR